MISISELHFLSIDDHFFIGVEVVRLDARVV